MDSFTAIFFAKTDDITAQPPVDAEGSGGPGNGYCVVSRELVVSTPVDEEGSGGPGNGYCVIA